MALVDENCTTVQTRPSLSLHATLPSFGDESEIPYVTVGVARKQ